MLSSWCLRLATFILLVTSTVSLVHVHGPDEEDVRANALLDSVKHLFDGQAPAAKKKHKGQNHHQASPEMVAQHDFMEMRIGESAEDFSVSFGNPSTCATLVNHGFYSSIDVGVGTPSVADGEDPNKPAIVFPVIADTGSDTLIVQSCTCQAKGDCNTGETCFDMSKYGGTSCSFELLKVKRDFINACGKNKTKDFAQFLVITFGSGPIGGLIGSDVVTIGKATSTMPNGMLFMTQSNLDFGSSIPGILGLGPPAKLYADWAETAKPGMIPSRAMMSLMRTNSKHEVVSEDDYEADENAPEPDPTLLKLDRRSGPAQASAWDPAQTSAEYNPVSFLEQANMSQFSICFKDGSDGVLRMWQNKNESGQHFDMDVAGGKVRRSTQNVTNVGVWHWSVGLQSIAVGNTTHREKLGVCDWRWNETYEGQETACGAIPDSGTTLMLGPYEHVLTLLDVICDNWDRCRDNYTAMVKAAEGAHDLVMEEWGQDPWDIKPVDKFDVMSNLLWDCGSWTNDSWSVSDEMPDIHFQVGGRKGNSTGRSQWLSLPAAAYIWSEEIVNKDGWDQICYNPGSPWEFCVETAPDDPNDIEYKTVCDVAFNVFEYTTTTNGPVWIFGTAIFYEYVVGYDLHDNSITFTSQEESPCGACRHNGEFDPDGDRLTPTTTTTTPTTTEWTYPSADLARHKKEHRKKEKAAGSTAVGVPHRQPRTKPSQFISPRVDTSRTVRL